MFLAPRSICSLRRSNSSSRRRSLGKPPVSESVVGLALEPALGELALVDVLDMDDKVQRLVLLAADEGDGDRCPVRAAIGADVALLEPIGRDLAGE